MENNIEVFEFRIMDRFWLYNLLQLIGVGFGLGIAFLLLLFSDPNFAIITGLVIIIAINLYFRYQLEPLCRFELSDMGMKQIYLRKILLIQISEKAIPYHEINSYEIEDHELNLKLKSLNPHKLSYYQTRYRTSKDEEAFYKFKVSLSERITEFNARNPKEEMIEMVPGFFQTNKPQIFIVIIGFILLYMTYSTIFHPSESPDLSRIILGYFFGLIFIGGLIFGIRKYRN